MTWSLADRTRKFWCAAYFYRRADPARDRAVAVKALAQVTATASGTVQDRAANLLREINDTDRRS
ncbi:hypothetical protein EN742_01640 [Mesorhizobium sp. M4A.F.Ca.ET.020.02.1.1]|uniref:hypothetical protein n=1 Tax=Mesorhizobium sp. M4A.F.Ca.ET.020.02.1.1 TaxID=2496652 RepID=UPI000FD53C3C|nr:hypothetical protein [Mesorhizobium sp. M4A.F.Ca.ET.020.02.1.1]RVD44645.1 hypothetical protein EN742_01640 [Mesorhizobium sp. M4A.F.Ca.ET.020.02.1.1]